MLGGEMADSSLAQALTKEHHEIDSGIEEFAAGLERDEPIGTLAPPLRKAMTALRRHIYLEEVFAFPPIREGGLTMPIMVMEREHRSEERRVGKECRTGWSTKAQKHNE